MLEIGEKKLAGDILYVLLHMVVVKEALNYWEGGRVFNLITDKISKSCKICEWSDGRNYYGLLVSF